MSGDKPKTGEAIIFFDHNAILHDIETEIPELRESLMTPSNLEISVIENWHDNLKLELAATQVDCRDRRYAMVAQLPGERNIAVTHLLIDLIHGMYLSDLFDKGASMRAVLIIKAAGKYLPVESYV